MEAPTTRTCKKCGETKDFKLFAEALMCNFGRSHVCKKCNAEKHREYRKLRVKKPKKPRQLIEPLVKRICKNCQETKPLELFTEVPKYKFGRSYTCKKCTEKKDTDRSLIKYYKLKSKKAKLQIISKTCRACKETKDFELFKVHKPAKFGRANICKKCHNEKSIKYLKTERGKEKVRVRVKRYYAKNKITVKERRKKYYDKQVENVGISYLKGIISQKLNIPASTVTNEQLQLQKESILLHRELEKLKQQIL